MKKIYYFQRCVHLDVHFVLLWLLHFKSALAGNGALDSITWYEKFSQETTKACSFILFPFSLFLLSMFHCSTKVSLSPSKRTVVRTPLSLWTM